MKKQSDPRERRGLRESLEAYAQRLSLKADAVRPLWRAQGLRSLDASFPGHAAAAANFEKLLRASRVRVCPGVCVPCGPEPKDVIEIEPDEQSSAVNSNNEKGN